MGTCNSSSKSSGGSLQNKIKQEFINHGLNSPIAGVRKKAQEGIGNYSFKNAKAVTAKEFEKAAYHSRVITRGEYTLLDGFLEDGKNNKSVFYANKTNSPEMQKLLKMRAKSQTPKKGNTDMTGKTTTTYDRFLKRLHKKFDDYYYGGK